MRISTNRYLPTVAAATLIVVATGCTSTEFSTDVSGDVGFLTIALEIPEGQDANAQLGADFSVRIDEGEERITITDSWLVLEDMQLRRAGGECTDSASSEGCVEIFSQPDALRMPVNSPRIELGTVQLEPGSYDQLQFDFHRLEEGDEQLLTNPETKFEVGASVSLIGSISTPDGQGGTNTRPFDPALFGPEATVEVPAGLTIIAGERATVTIFADVDSWFRGPGGLIDPVAAQSDETLAVEVRSNILDSFSIR